MKQEFRRKHILKLLDKNEVVSIQELVSQCSISEITARRDLTLLEKQGLLKRTHGGATRNYSTTEMIGFDTNALDHQMQKINICNLASTLIEDNDTIYMDCGTTVFYLARFLPKFKNIRVITNSLPIVLELLPYPNIVVNLIGGELDNSLKAFYGSMTESLMARYKADKAFIGTGGISLANGLSSNSEKSALVTLKMAEAASKVYLLCDSSKIEKDSYFNFSGLSLIETIITDNEISQERIDLYKEKNINILTT